MKLRLASPATLIDIGRIPGLSYIRKEKDRLLIGSMTTHNEVAESLMVKATCEVLSEAASQIGDQQVRNRGTIGGTICHADPAADVPATVLALDAEFKVVGTRSRMIKARDFFRDIFTTGIRRGEILTEVRIPVLPSKSGGSYVKLGRGSNDLATVGVAAIMTLDGFGKCTDARLGLAGVDRTPMRATNAERVLEGNKPTGELIAEAGEKAAKTSHPTSDIRGTAEYKRDMVAVHVRRAVWQSLGKI